jgi:hypothetical protein
MILLAFEQKPSRSFTMPMSIEQLAARHTAGQSSLPQKPGPRPGPARDLGTLAAPEPRRYTKLKIVSNDKCESILFGWDSNNWRLTIWLPSPTPGQEWIFFEPEFRGVEDFDLLSNHLQGRKDDTIDLVVMAYDASLAGQCLYFPALPFSTRLEDWQAYFSRPIDLTSLRPKNAWQVRLGLLPKARRSVFICGTSPGSVAATRCDVDENGQITGYPFDLGPEWNNGSGYQIFEPCVAARQPESFTFDDGLVGSYAPADTTQGVVKVMLPKAPLGRAWELTPLPPLVGYPHWSTVTGISTFLRIDTGEPIITFVMSRNEDSPLNKAVWVMNNDTLYHSNKGCWWLAAPPDEAFPPSSPDSVCALPVQMKAGQPPTWIWLQTGDREDPERYFLGVIASRSAKFFNEGASNAWLAEPADHFDASLAGSPTVPGETVARVFMAADMFLSDQTVSLTFARLDNASDQWLYQSVPLPGPPPGP